jgi:3D (Asp-Asp-Asp) domain-containing protein
MTNTKTFSLYCLAICLAVQLITIADVSTSTQVKDTRIVAILPDVKMSENDELESQYLLEIKRQSRVNATRQAQERQNKTVVLHTNKKISISRGDDPRHGKSFIMTATAYGETLLNGGSGQGLTCTGVKPIEGRTIAADRRILPMGTKVYIECPTYPQINGYRIVEDVGGAIKGKKIDVYMDDLDASPTKAHKRIMNFGVRKVIVHVISN